MINYLTLLLINMVAGLCLLGVAVLVGLGSEKAQKMAPGLALSGLVALFFGAAICLTWPLPGSFNMVFGELSVLFGAVLAGVGICLFRRWDLQSVAIYGFFAGIVAVVLGIGIIHLELTQKPLFSGVGFILTGLGGVLFLPLSFKPENLILRSVVSALLLLSMLTWALTGYMAYWSHLPRFSDWTPDTMLERSSAE
ncbi:MAG: DUF981 family protein [Candidatus Brocadiia bacterium]